MGEVATEAMRREQVEVEACLAPETDHGAAEERERAVAAAVTVVAASARRGVVALCASVAHIIRKNIRLQQQVMELESRLRGLERPSVIPEDSSAYSQCQDNSSSQEYSSATSQCPSTSDSLPESPSSQRCGSAPPHFPAGFLRPYQGCGVTPRKTSDPEGEAAFLRGRTRASTGNLTHCSPAAAFVRRKYNSISLRRVRRSTTTTTTTTAVRKGRVATADSRRSSTTSLEQQQHQNISSSNTSSKACAVNVAEVYPASNSTTSTEGEAVKLLAQKLTNVLQEDSSHHQDDIEDLVLCSPHPLAGCECVLCLQLFAHPDMHPYEIITDEGSLLPRGSTVLVRGQRVGTVVYFGHRKYQARGSSSTQALLLPPTVPGTCDTTADGPTRSLSSPLGVTVALWPPDEGEVFVPLSDVVCQLDDDGGSGSLEERAGLVMEEGSGNRHVGGENTATKGRGDSMHLDHTLTEPQDNIPVVSKEKVYMTEDLWDPVGSYGVANRGEHLQDRHRRSASDSNCMYETLEGERVTAQAIRGGRMETAAKRCTSATSKTTDVTLKRTQAIGVDHRLQDSTKCNRQHSRLCLECEDDPEAQYCNYDRGKLQFGDTWDSGCYMSLGRHSSECSEQLSDLESEYGSSGQPWANSLEDALDCVWKKHKHQGVINLGLLPKRLQTDTFVVDSEIEMQTNSFAKR